jgi:uncharacterized protein (UPF0297 family)
MGQVKILEVCMQSNESITEARRILQEVYNALLEKGYDPITQIVGYLLTEDPTYITNYNSARAMIRRIDRNDLLEEIVRVYFQEKSQT